MLEDDKKSELSSYRVTDLPQLTDLNSHDLFLITHLKDDYGNYESQSIPFKRMMNAIKRRGFKEELATLSAINSTYVDDNELAEALKKYAFANHNHDAAYSKIDHAHDDKYASLDHKHDNTYAMISHKHSVDDVIGLSIPNKVSELEQDIPYLSAHQSLSGYAKEDWVEENFADAIHHHVTSDIKDFPTQVSEFDNDAGFITDADVEAKYGLKTIFRDWSDD